MAVLLIVLTAVVSFFNVAFAIVFDIILIISTWLRTNYSRKAFANLHYDTRPSFSSIVLRDGELIRYSQNALLLELTVVHLQAASSSRGLYQV